jgi:hypothetical protein
MDKPPTVVARVLLRSAEGARPSVSAVADHFRRAGFVVLGTPGITIGISGTKALFEQHFGHRLAYGADHAYTLRTARTSEPATGLADSAADPTSIPTDGLPAPIRQAISQIALEAAVSADQPRVDP